MFGVAVTLRLPTYRSRLVSHALEEAGSLQIRTQSMYTHSNSAERELATKKIKISFKNATTAATTNAIIEPRVRKPLCLGVSEARVRRTVVGD